MPHLPLPVPRTASPTPLSTAELLERICVCPPYFALRGVRFDGTCLSAEVSAEAPRGAEIGPMQGAELSRHAAIAGLCRAALAQEDGKRRYYLAQRASYEGFRCDAPYGSVVTVEAELDAWSKRAVRAAIRARVGDLPLARLEVDYTVLTEAAFDRLFQSRRQPTFSGAAALGTLPPGHLNWCGPTLTRAIEQVPADACAGHFDHYPAMPVAILMGQLAELAGAALEGGARAYRIVRGQVEAQDFCWAGESARFEVTPQEQDGKTRTFHCAAHAGGRLTGSMTLTLEPVTTPK